MSPASATAISQTQGFLAEIFSQRGADCPYDPQFHPLIRQHLLDLVGDIPSLTVKQQLYTHYDGRSARLLVAEGTVPMYYQGVKYNIPVALWLPERYPLYPPLMYVVPTPDMVIKPRHQFVDPSGLVASPYLRNWGYPASNLRELAQDASILFSGDPPLFSKPPGWTPPAASAGAGRPPGGYPPPQGQQQQQQQHGSSGPHSPTAFHAENPMANLSLGGPSFTGSSGPSFTGGSGPSFTGSSGGSFSARPSGSGGSYSQPSNAPYGTAGSGGMSGWGAAIAGGMGAAAGAAASGAGHPPPPQPYPSHIHGAGIPPPLGSGPPAQQQQQEAAAAAAAGRPPQADSSSAAEDASRELRAAFRTAALSTLSRRLAASVAAASSGAAAEVDKWAQAQAELARREAHLQQEVATLQAERTALDKAAQDLGGAAAQLDAWLANNERAAAAVAGGPGGSDGGGGGAAALDPDSVIVAADPLSQQALEVQALDLALEDALLALDKALNAGLVQPDAYIKQVRALCRQQFMARAVGNKIAAKQAEARRRSPARPAAPAAAGPGPYPLPQHGPPPPPPAIQQQGVQMPMGDSWFNTGVLANPLAAQQR